MSSLLKQGGEQVLKFAVVSLFSHSYFVVAALQLGGIMKCLFYSKVEKDSMV